MIPNYQKILFAFLLLASLAMGGMLWRLRERAHDRLVSGADSAPTRAPEVAPAEQATLIVAGDSDGSLRMQIESLPLPAEPGARAHAVLGRLLDLYAAEGATHPVQGGASSVAQVFLMPVRNFASAATILPLPAGSLRVPCRQPGQPYEPMDEKMPCAGEPKSGGLKTDTNGPELAVVNLAGTFAASHPSGIETETLTVLSICGTLHANLPRVTEVRFLVDGKERATLAGHADLTRIYLAADAAPSAGATQ